MKIYILLIPIIASFLTTLALLPSWIKKAKQIGLVWEDMNKYKKYFVSGSGGIIAVLGFVIGVLLYVSYKVFLFNSKDGNLVEIFALLSCILLLATVGFIDDLLGWRKGGLSKKSRIILELFAAIPLIVINAGRSSVILPFFGGIDLGLWYPLVIIPIGIVGAATTFNILAGFNGLEAGQGIIVLSGFSLVAYMLGDTWLTLIGLCMIAALCAFIIFNFNPARVFPGDSLTYTVGGLAACMAILGNFEKIAVFFFIPYALESILKLRGDVKMQSFGLPQKDGSLELRYDKIYSVNHLSICLMKKIGVKPTESRVVISIWTFQILIILIGLLIFRRGF